MSPGQSGGGPSVPVHPTQHPGQHGGSTPHGWGPRLAVRLRHAKGLTRRDVLRQPIYIPAIIGDDQEDSRDAGWQDIDTIGAGQFSVPSAGKHAPKLRTWQREFLVMNWDPKWMLYKGQDPRHVIREFERVLDSRTPVHYLEWMKPPIRGFGGPEFSGLVTLRNLTRRQTHGEADTRYLTIQITEFRDMRIGRRRHGGGRGSHHHGRLPTTHKINSFDTLRLLAHHYYGEGSLWRLIAHANGIKHWGSEDPLVDMQRYKVGDKVRIPKRDHDGGDGGWEDFWGLDGQAAVAVD